ncbi:MAG: FAD binding domain-containing protein [Actinomycetes bacterium]
MKPPPFTYHAPGTVDEATAVLASLGSDAKVLAGGQSLVPLLSMRLAAPGHLVDINRLGAELGGVRVVDGGVRVGALARHAEVERDAAASARLPLLRQALRLVAHPVIRNRGTTVGSLVHADPSGEMPAVLALLGGSVQVARAGAGPRTVGADDFFVGPLESALQPGELAVAAFFPCPPGRVGTSFVEVTRRHGDYAVCGVAALVTLDGGDRPTTARAAYVSMAPTPLVLDLSEVLTHGSGTSRTADEERMWSAAGDLARTRVEPEADIHATAEYRRHLAGVLTTRALREAAAHARRTSRVPEGSGAS